MYINYAKKFRKQRDKAPEKIKEAFTKRLGLFLEDPFHPLLNNHALTGEFLGTRSINITGDWRALYSEYNLEDGKLIIFHLLNTHSELYK